jgi:hypothetical protein
MLLSLVAKISPLALQRAFLFFPLCNATDERP